MRKYRTRKNRELPGASQTSELLILPDGRILVHNLTRPFAELLHKLNPNAEQISSRLSRRNEVKADVTRHCASPCKPGRADLPVSLAAQQRRPTGSMHNSKIIKMSHELPN